MVWQLDWGAHANKIIAAATERGGKVPPLPFLDRKPLLPAHLGFELAAFFDLSADRPSGLSIGYIPWLSIDRYASRYGIDSPDEFDRFFRMIRAMDGAYIEREVARLEQERKRK